MPDTEFVLFRTDFDQTPLEISEVWKGKTTHKSLRPFPQWGPRC